MAPSTDAVLFYGYCWDEETQSPWKRGHPDTGDKSLDDDDDDGWEDRYARTKNLLPPSASFPEHGAPPTNYSVAEQAIIDQYHAYWEAKRRLVETSTCLIDTHCSASCPMPYIAVRASVTNSSRGFPNKITSLEVDPSWGILLTEFCTAMKIQTANKKPAWWLVSYWEQ